jgi:EAL domain-containing protein (putative c-di-GMP-specific phosphodiesterase class I)
MPYNTKIFQSDMYKFWLFLETEQDDACLVKLSQTLNDTFNINNIPLYVEFTIGIVDNQGPSAYEHFKYSDTAGYYAQQLKKPFCFYEVSKQYTNTNFELLGDFNAALETGQLILHYQPILNPVNKEVVGLEALLRWYHPTRGSISPTEFIELVEETQMINPLTEWVVKQSLDMLTRLKEEGIDTKISINISAKNLRLDFLEYISTLLNAHPLSQNIEFEITESALMDDPDACQILLDKLRFHGIQLAIDDFGTGYSSLTYLSRFPIQVVKIDQYFIKLLLSDVGIYHIVKSTIDLGHKLGMKVLAEGVEEQAIEELLIDIDCDLVQGYYYAKPMKDEDIIGWYKQHDSLYSSFRN